MAVTRRGPLRSLGRVETGAANRSLARFSPDHRLLATSSLDEPLATRDTTDGRVLTRLMSGEQPPIAVAFAGSRDLVSAAEKGVTVWSPDPRATPKPIDGLYDDGVPTAAAFGKGDHEVVVGSDQGRVSIRDTKTWGTTDLTAVHKGSVRALTVSPDKRTLATGGDDGVITLWHTATWQKIGDLRGHTGSVTALEFTPDSSRLASGGIDKKIIVWDLDIRAPWATLSTQGVSHLAWMPDGHTIVSAGADALLTWPLDIDEALRRLKPWVASGQVHGVLATGEDGFVAPGQQVGVVRDGADVSRRGQGNGAGRHTVPRAGSSRCRGRRPGAGSMGAARCHLRAAELGKEGRLSCAAA